MDMKKKLAIPQFKNEDEECEFWSNLDLSEYYEAKNFHHFDLEQFLKEHGQPKSTRVTMRLPAELVSKVKQQAEALDVPYQSLMKLYIKKGADAGVRQ
jgi:predicted DNA binding CopG/RHH family protein